MLSHRENDPAQEAEALEPKGICPSTWSVALRVPLTLRHASRRFASMSSITTAAAPDTLVYSTFPVHIIITGATPQDITAGATPQVIIAATTP